MVCLIFSLGLFHKINRLSCMQHIHVHTPSGDKCQSPSDISSRSAPFTVLISIRRSSRRESSRFTNRWSSYQTEESVANNTYCTTMVCIKWNKKFPALTSIRFASFISSSRTFFDFLGCMVQVWSRLP